MSRLLEKAWYSFKAKYPNVDQSERKAFFEGAATVLQEISNCSRSNEPETFRNSYSDMVKSVTTNLGDM